MTARRVAAPRWLSPIAARAASSAAGLHEAAFRELYAHTAGRLLGFLICRTGGDRSAAEDLLQETYYRLLRAPDLPCDLEGRTRLAFRIAINLARDRDRRERVRERPLPPSPTAGTGCARACAAELGDALAALHPRERDLLWLAYVEGASHREIAAIAGVREASVRPILYRARRKIAALLRPARPERSEP